LLFSRRCMRPRRPAAPNSFPYSPNESRSNPDQRRVLIQSTSRAGVDREVTRAPRLSVLTRDCFQRSSPDSHVLTLLATVDRLAAATASTTTCSRSHETDEEQGASRRDGRTRRQKSGRHPSEVGAIWTASDANQIKHPPRISGRRVWAILQLTRAVKPASSERNMKYSCRQKKTKPTIYRSANLLELFVQCQVGSPRGERSSSISPDLAKRCLDRADGISKRALSSHAKTIWHAQANGHRSLREKLQGVHEIVFQGRVDGLRILFASSFRLSFRPVPCVCGPSSRKTFIGDSIKAMWKLRVPPKAADVFCTRAGKLPEARIIRHSEIARVSCRSKPRPPTTGACGATRQMRVIASTSNRETRSHHSVAPGSLTLVKALFAHVQSPDQEVANADQKTG